jgi:hypothetical protein
VTTRTNFVLVDFENVQPQDIGLLKDGPFKVKVFLGPNQSKIPISLAASLQSLGENAEYIVLETAGNNALDFHLAYYIGVLSAAEPTAFFHVISKDTGFDSLLKHLKGKKEDSALPDNLWVELGSLEAAGEVDERCSFPHGGESTRAGRRLKELPFGTPP